MNVYVVGLNVPGAIADRILPSLKNMTAIFPQLDHGTAWQQRMGTSVIACLHNAPSTLGTRRYRADGDEAIVIYEGVLVPAHTDFAAHDASALAARWHLLPGGVDGQFVIFRATPTSLEMINDAAGIEQIYYYRSGDVWLFANHVGLLADIVGASTTNVLGVAEFLTSGSPQGDRTLVQEIGVVPPGQHWTWAGEREPRKRSYFDWNTLSQRASVDLDALGQTLGGFCRAVSRQYGPIECALTAGRDTRVLAALLIHNGIPAEYYTTGLPATPDGRIAKLIANRLGLSHRHRHTNVDELAERWDELSDRVIRQHDGLVSLWQIADISDHQPCIDRLRLNLWGHGALARGAYSSPRLFLRRLSPRAAVDYVTRAFISSNPLIRGQAVTEAVRELRRFASNALQAGISPYDIPDLVFAETRNRRWGGNNARKSRAVSDRFSPFCTAVFVRAAFSLEPIRRLSEPLHYGLVKRLSLELHRLPFEKPWRFQHAAVNIAALLWPQVVRKVRSKIGVPAAPQEHGPAYQARLMEQKYRDLREFCLDRAHSALWDVVDRTEFDRVMSQRTDRIERQRCGSILFDIVTLFKSEALLSGS
jgi:asparagine synthase (glutamine-hydrolysing)